MHNESSTMGLTFLSTHGAEKKAQKEINARCEREREGERYEWLTLTVDSRQVPHVLVASSPHGNIVSLLARVSFSVCRTLLTLGVGATIVLTDCSFVSFSIPRSATICSGRARTRHQESRAVGGWPRILGVFSDGTIPYLRSKSINR